MEVTADMAKKIIHSPKTVEVAQDALKTIFGPVPINSPRDRDGSFAPQIAPKRTTDISDIEGKVLAMYAKGMRQRDIADVIDDIYGFKLSHAQISVITNSVLDELAKWQSRPLRNFIPSCL